MKAWIVIVGILLFAAATAFLYGWGLMRSRDEQKTLLAMLTGKCEKKLRQYLKKNGSISRQEAAKLLESTSVSLFYSRKKFGVTDGYAFSGAVLERMEKLGVLQKEGERYRLAANH